MSLAMERELLLRVATASVLFVAVLFWLFRTPSPWFEMLLGLFAIAVTTELLTLVGLIPLRWFGLVAASVWAFLLIGGDPLTALLFLWLVWGVMALFVARRGEVAARFQALAAAGLVMVWLVLFVSMVLRLHARPDGTLFLAGACLAVWGSDVAAYLVGRAWGRRRLAPAISPGKSIEGVWAGVALGTLVGALFWQRMVGMGLLSGLMLGLLVTLTGVAGDLMESMLKRSFGAKESGVLLPGHGGLLDRIDALLPSIPVAGLLWLRVTQ